MPKLRIVCDDIGLSALQNEHVFELARAGRFNGASILTNYAHAEEAYRRLQQIGIVDIGVHLNLSDGYPVASTSSRSALLDRQGIFRDRLWLYYRGWWMGRRLNEQVRNELNAQVERFASWGALPTHLSSHCHFHAIPAMSELLREVASEFGIPRIRTPHLRANLSPQYSERFPKRGRGVLIDGQREHLVLMEKWLMQPPHLLVAAIAHCEGHVELVVHPGCAPDADFPVGFQYPPAQRAKESAYLRRFMISLMADNRGIEMWAGA